MLPFVPAAAATPIMLSAVQSLYGIAASVNDFINRHIDDLVKSENETISRTGRILEGVKTGFGLGYFTPVIIIATGQILLGNNLGALSTLATAGTLSNPIAMTCAGVGAVLYGWSALSSDEKDILLGQLSKGLEIGKELIKSVIAFVIDLGKKIFNKENLEEIKKFISSVAKDFGKTLGEITGKIGDKIHDAYDFAKETSAKSIAKTKELAQATANSASNTIGTLYTTVEQSIDQSATFTSEAYKKLTTSKVKAESQEIPELNQKSIEVD